MWDFEHLSSTLVRHINRATHNFLGEMPTARVAYINLTVATGESWIGNLSNKELNDIFRLTS